MVGEEDCASELEQGEECLRSVTSRRIEAMLLV